MGKIVEAVLSTPSHSEELWNELSLLFHLKIAAFERNGIAFEGDFSEVFLKAFLFECPVYFWKELIRAIEQLEKESPQHIEEAVRELRRIQEEKSD